MLRSSDEIRFASAILLIVIVLGVNQRQEARAEAIKANPEKYGSSPPPSNPYSLLQG